MIYLNQAANRLKGLRSQLISQLDPKLYFKRQDLQNIKKRTEQQYKKHKNQMNKQNGPYRKVIFGLCLYGIGCFMMYQLKKQKAILIGYDDTLQAIKKSQIRQIIVVQQKYEAKLFENNQNKQVQQNQLNIKRQALAKYRKIYFKIQCVEYFTYVSDIQFFYQKIKEVEKNKTQQKVRIIQKQQNPYDKRVHMFVNVMQKIVQPLLIPILLYNSSMGKLFKSKLLGQSSAIRPNIKFKDIAGLGNAKIQISQLVDFLRNPKKYKQIGAKVPKGALLTGPPGTGKTMLAKACAGQANVPFFSVSGSEFVQLFAGMGANRVRQLFANAKKQTPAIIFIDEIDAIGRKRQDKFGGANDQRANTLNQLLVEMDGFGTNSDIIILAATNRKQMLDTALTRPGRFDRLVQIQLPDIKGRQQILQIYLKKINLSPQQSLSDYAKRLATLTYGFSGADLANLCNQAAILAVRKNKQYVQPSDFQSASDRVLAGLQQNLTLNPIQKKKIAYHEAGHAVVAWFCQGSSPLLKITIVPRSKGSLGFAQYLPNQSSLMNKKHLYDQICVILGGRTAQQHFFKQISSGASDDLKKVRNLAKSIVVRFGMSQLFPNYAPPETDGQNIYSEQTSEKIDKQIIRIINECTEMTRNKVKEYSQKIQKLAQQVLKKQTLNHVQIKQILGERPYEIKQNYKQFLQQSKQDTTSRVNL